MSQSTVSARLSKSGSSVQEGSGRRVIPIREDSGFEEVSLFKSEDKIVPRSVWGRFAKIRWVMVWLTQLAFYGTAWLQYNGRQALLFDLEARRFFIGPLVFYPQDFIYLTALLVVSALCLFLFTAVAGRVWCGYACPQTVYTEIFMWFERKIEGDRAERLRMAKGPWNFERISKSTGKHAVWGVFALLTGFSFVGYFTPIRDLSSALMQWALGPWEVFWILFYSFATYGNAGWMREQVCKYMCPYARFQSAMFDRDTLLVTYDEERGEPRGARGKKVDPLAAGLGSCVDCNLCVQVCPTGIDIRKGLQYECIGCAACVDVCDGVMDKMGYAKGLIRYSTQNGMLNRWDYRQLLDRLFRPRVLIYTGIVWTLIALLGVSLVMRQDLKVDVIKDRAVTYRLADNGLIENVYRLMIMNTTEYPLTVDASLPESLGSVMGLRFAGEHTWTLHPLEARWVVVQILGEPESLKAGSNRILIGFESLRVKEGEANQAPETLLEEAVMIAPR